jgi:hypothetical protein
MKSEFAKSTRVVCVCGAGEIWRSCCALSRNLLPRYTSSAARILWHFSWSSCK